MRNISNKVDNIDTLSAAEFNVTFSEEQENAVTKSGITLDAAGGPDTNSFMFAEALTRTAQGGATYQDGGIADAYVLTAIGGFEQPDAYTDGMAVTFKVGNLSTGSVTVNVASIGVKAIVDNTGAPLTGGELSANAYVTITFDLGNDRFELNTGVAAAGGAVETGTVVDFAGSSAPSGYELCFGQELNRTTFAALFAVIGTAYGVGNGSTTFNLPDARGRTSAGKDDMGGVSANRLTNQSGGLNGDTLGASGGGETHTLTIAQLAAHFHRVASQGAPSVGALSLNIAGSFRGSALTNDELYVSNTAVGSLSTYIENTGGGAAHNNVQPTLIFNKIIKT
ncbi:MAG: phage tail protein [Candidatus Anammoxibacter sp.]